MSLLFICEKYVLTSSVTHIVLARLQIYQYYVFCGPICSYVIMGPTCSNISAIYTLVVVRVCGILLSNCLVIDNVLVYTRIFFVNIIKKFWSMSVFYVISFIIVYIISFI